VLPDGAALPSGGNIYNAELARAVARIAGASATGATAAIEHDVCVSTQTVHDWKLRIAAGEPGTYLVDTLLLGDAGAIESRHPGQRFVLVVHHLPSLEPGAISAAALDDERRALGLFDGFLATSAFTAQHLVASGVDARRIVTVEPASEIALPRTSFAADRPPTPMPSVTPAAAWQLEPQVDGAPDLEPHFDGAPLRAVMVGNLIPRKRVADFLEALDERAAVEDAFTLDVVGRLDIDAEYARRAVEIGRKSETLREKVRFSGAVSYDEVSRVYRDARVFVSAAAMETFGMALQEARAFGLPILACDAGNVRAHVEPGETGMLFDGVDTLAEGFLGLVRDPALAAVCLRRARTARAPNPYGWLDAARLLIDGLDALFP
jgi:glycosyltransferase involved in cell wall biosynthesis